MRCVAVLTALALSMLGCGGSDSDTDPTPAGTVTTTTAPGTDDTTTTGYPEPNDQGSDDSFSPGNCPELLAWANDSVAASAAAFGGGTNAAGLAFTADYFQEFADRAPGEIRDDMQVFADAFSAFFETLEDLDIDFTDPANLATLDAATIEQLEDASEWMDSDEVDQAMANIEAFFERECS